MAFGAWVAWFINRTLDRKFPKDPEVLRLQPSKTTLRPVTSNNMISPPQSDLAVTKPAPEAKFHDQFASAFEVTNPAWQLGITESPEFGFNVELNRKLRADLASPIPDFKDLNTTEIKGIAKAEHHFGTVLFPCGLRTSPTPDQISSFREVLTANWIEPHKRLQLDFTRPFNDGCRSHTGFGAICPDCNETFLLFLS